MHKIYLALIFTKLLQLLEATSNDENFYLLEFHMFSKIQKKFLHQRYSIYFVWQSITLCAKDALYLKRWQAETEQPLPKLPTRLASKKLHIVWPEYTTGCLMGYLCYILLGYTNNYHYSLLYILLQELDYLTY